MSHMAVVLGEPVVWNCGCYTVYLCSLIAWLMVPAEAGTLKRVTRQDSSRDCDDMSFGLTSNCLSAWKLRAILVASYLWPLSGFNARLCVCLCACLCACVCQYLQLEKTRGQECSSIGKLWSCSWHSALMVILERERDRKTETKTMKGLKNDWGPSFCSHMVRMYGTHLFVFIFLCRYAIRSAGFRPDGAGSHSVAQLMWEIPQNDRTV